MNTTTYDQKLNTDSMEAKYGHITLEIRKHNDSMRETMMNDMQGIGRTYALTFFPQNMAPEVQEVNRWIQYRGFVGQSFRDAGFDLEKRTLDEFTIQIPSWLQKDFRTESINAKVKVYDMVVSKNGQSYLYGTIAEVYHPDFKAPENIESDNQDLCSKKLLVWRDLISFYVRTENQPQFTHLEDCAWA
jgi:hypothetical protein